MYQSLLENFVKEENFKGQFTYVAFLDLKKANDSIPIFNILNKNSFTLVSVTNGLISFLSSILPRATNEDHNFHILKIMINIVKSKKNYCTTV